VVDGVEVRGAGGDNLEALKQIALSLVEQSKSSSGA
jgi:hypothetical protein